MSSRPSWPGANRQLAIAGVFWNPCSSAITWIVSCCWVRRKLLCVAQRPDAPAFEPTAFKNVAASDTDDLAHVRTITFDKKREALGYSWTTL